MRPCARYLRGFLLGAALAVGGAAVAQEVQLDPKALDPSGAGAVQTKRGKGRKGAEAAAQPAAPGKPSSGGGGGPNRQFGELEGWSPGKAPPKPKDKQEDKDAGSSKPPVTMSPSGNMGTGFAF